MIVFIDDILNGNIAQLLGDELYSQTIAHVVEWWAILPMVGLILAFSFVMVGMFRGRGK